MEIKFGSNHTPLFSFGFFAKVLIMSIAIIIATYVLPGVKISDPFAAILGALVIALLNIFLRPILIVLTLPFTILSLGFFILIINAVIIIITTKIVPGVDVDNFWWALLLSLFITFVSYLLDIPARMLNRRYPKGKEQETIDFEHNDDGFDDYEEIKEEDNNKNTSE